MNKIEKEPRMYGKIPKWNQENFNNRNCPFCRSRGDFVLTRPDNLKINYCTFCGSFFVSPSPNENELNDLYNNYSSFYHKVELNQYLANRIFSIHPLCDIRVREITSNILPKGKKLLDVGCGYGQNLILYKNWAQMLKV